MSYGSDAWGQALALENAQVENEPVEIADRNAFLAAADAYVSGVSPRFHQTVQALDSQLRQLKQARDAADQAVVDRARRERWSVEHIRNEREKAIGPFVQPIEDVQNALDRARDTLAQQNRARLALDAFLASEASEHAAIDQECQQRHAQLHATRRRLEAALLD